MADVASEMGITAGNMAVIPAIVAAENAGNVFDEIDGVDLGYPDDPEIVMHIDFIDDLAMQRDLEIVMFMNFIGDLAVQHDCDIVFSGFIGDLSVQHDCDIVRHPGDFVNNLEIFSGTGHRRLDADLGVTYTGCA
jgi:hypothetical protein